MKYIVIRVEVGDLMPFHLPVVFPHYLVHADMANAVMRRGLPRNYRNPVVVAAGDVHWFGEGARCSGHSETLKIGSRGKPDEVLINGIDYGAGYMYDDAATEGA